MLYDPLDEFYAENANLYQDYLCSLKGRSIALYGAGGTGYATCGILKNHGLEVVCFIEDDAAKQGTSVAGISVVALSDVPIDTDHLILLCVPNPADVYQRLRTKGYLHVHYFPVLMGEKDFYTSSLILENKNKIQKVYSLLADELSKLAFGNLIRHRLTTNFSLLESILSEKQYFPEDLFTLCNQECFVDGGAYHGETIAEFLQATQNHFRYIYAFEPDQQNFDILEKNTIAIPDDRIQRHNAGLYSQMGEIGFTSLGNSGSSVSSESYNHISIVALDDVIGIHKPTYIKLDIEGAEGEALIGMKNTIAVHRPKLAVSVYHKPEDLWELPLTLHDYNPSYRLYIRHYTQSLYETVCYAL